ncbi:hypothetical protein PMIN01_02337 [Paraphaeosphaeria minitans]|uniref:Uncharacterized protein n=1 Tax=Paraphaeosphaeria minitans TaxID=565426 RepID=A0A9P6KU98_9PLEO|nr:hypothetical protein PMIN01_02337 [Paraphaeosphaeria minitans]
MRARRGNKQQGGGGKRRHPCKSGRTSHLTFAAASSLPFGHGRRKSLKSDNTCKCLERFSSFFWYTYSAQMVRPSEDKRRYRNYNTENAVPQHGQSPAQEEIILEDRRGPRHSSLTRQTRGERTFGGAEDDEHTGTTYLGV